MSDALVKLILLDITREIEDVENFIKGMTEEQSLTDKKTQKAVAMSLQLIGESAAKLPDSFNGKHSEIEWHKMAGLRNRISHDYAGLDMELIWRIIPAELSNFNNKLQEISA